MAPAVANASSRSAGRPAPRLRSSASGTFSRPSRRRRTTIVFDAGGPAHLGDRPRSSTGTPIRTAAFTRPAALLFAAGYLDGGRFVRATSGSASVPPPVPAGETYVQRPVEPRSDIRRASPPTTSTPSDDSIRIPRARRARHRRLPLSLRSAPAMPFAPRRSSRPGRRSRAVPRPRRRDPPRPPPLHDAPRRLPRSTARTFVQDATREGILRGDADARDPRRCAPWLFTMSRANTALDFLRRYDRRHGESLDDPAPRQHARIPRPTDDPRDPLAMARRADRVRRASPSRRRSAVILKDVLGESLEGPSRRTSARTGPGRQRRCSVRGRTAPRETRPHRKPAKVTTAEPRLVDRLRRAVQRRRDWPGPAGDAARGRSSSTS